MQVRFTGSLELRRVAAGIKAAGDKGLGKEMSAALRKAAKPVAESIKTTLVKSMPHRGGYQATVAKSVRFRTQVRSGARSGSVRIITYVDGKAERRDIRRLDKGELRHPNWGRSRTVRGKGRVPNKWSTTKVPAEFHRRGTEKAADEAEKQLQDVIDVFAKRLLEG